MLRSTDPHVGQVLDGRKKGKIGTKDLVCLCFYPLLLIQGPTEKGSGKSERGRIDMGSSRRDSFRRSTESFY